MLLIFEEGYYEGHMAQLRKMVYRNQGITMNFKNYNNMNQTQ
jgi:hypothetical protein